MSRILVVEDEERIARFVERGLRAAGYSVDVAATGREASTALRTGRHDLVVLDLGLPDMDGVDLLRDLRGAGLTMPVVILSARDEVRDKVGGFESGADDYVTKPFAFEELLMRIRARLRDAGSTPARELIAGDVHLDLLTHRVTTPDHGEVELSKREFALLEALMRSPGAIRSREELLDRVWGYDFDPGSNVVEVYIAYLRRKMGAKRIRTVRGSGYRMEIRDAD